MQEDLFHGGLLVTVFRTGPHSLIKTSARHTYKTTFLSFILHYRVFYNTNFSVNCQGPLARMLVERTMTQFRTISRQLF